jgi:hypothetical protein
MSTFEKFHFEIENEVVNGFTAGGLIAEVIRLL